MKMSDLKQETYLGDNLYASFDEYGIKLKAPCADVDHYIWLTMGETLPSFLAYVDDLKVKLASHLKEQAVSEEK